MSTRHSLVLAAALATTLGIALTACSQAPEHAPSGGVSAKSPSASAPASPSSSADDEREGTPIRIVIGEQTLEATVWDTPTGQDLLTRLPLTLEFSDLSNQEKVGHVDPPLTMDGMPEGDDPQVGDLGWYAPWGNVVLYYGEVGYWDGIARIGTIHGDLSLFTDQTSDFAAILEAVE